MNLENEEPYDNNFFRHALILISLSHDLVAKQFLLFTMRIAPGKNKGCEGIYSRG